MCKLFVVEGGGILVLELAETRGPEVDLVFLLAVGCADVGTDEAAEERQANKDDGPSGL